MPSMKVQRARREEAQYHHILDAVGQTPLVRLPKSFDPSCRATIWLKLEFMNPGGSIKDRIARHMLLQAIAQGQLRPGGWVVESTSGNTGVGLAMASAALGYGCVLVIPDNISAEKIATVKALGAEVVLASSAAPPGDPGHYKEVGRRLAAERPGSWWANQFENPFNPEAHERGTGPELWAQCRQGLDIVVAGCGTGGTLAGLGRFFNQHHPQVRLVAADPEGSVYAHFWRHGTLPEPGNRHHVEGVGGDQVHGVFAREWIDQFRTISEAEAMRTVHRLAKCTGIFAGASSGLALAAALEEGRESPPGSQIAVILPDSGSRYLSSAYDPDWRAAHGVDPPSCEPSATIRDLLAEPPAFSVDAKAPAETAYFLLHRRSLRPLPVIGDGRLLGVFDEAELLAAMADGRDWQATPCDQWLQAAPPVLAAEDAWRQTVPVLQHHPALVVAGETYWSALDRRHALRAFARLGLRP